MNRRAQGMSINMIIIMALGLVVLIVSVVIFIRSSDNSRKALNNCEALGGSCDATKCSLATSKPYPLGACPATEGQTAVTCCLPDAPPAGATGTP